MSSVRKASFARSMLGVLSDAASSFILKSKLSISDARLSSYYFRLKDLVSAASFFWRVDFRRAEMFCIISSLCRFSWKVSSWMGIKETRQNSFLNLLHWVSSFSICLSFSNSCSFVTESRERQMRGCE